MSIFENRLKWKITPFYCILYTVQWWRKIMWGKDVWHVTDPISRIQIWKFMILIPPHILYTVQWIYQKGGYRLFTKIQRLTYYEVRIFLFFDIFLDNDLSDNQSQRKNEKTLTFCSKIGRLCCYFSTLTTNLIWIRVSENVAPSSELN